MTDPGVAVRTGCAKFCCEWRRPYIRYRTILVLPLCKKMPYRNLGPPSVSVQLLLCMSLHAGLAECRASSSPTVQSICETAARLELCKRCTSALVVSTLLPHRLVLYHVFIMLLYVSLLLVKS